MTSCISYIMTLHTTNSLPFQVRSVDRQRSSSSEILSRNSSDVTQTRQHFDTYSRFIQMQFFTNSSSGNPTPIPPPLQDFWKQFMGSPVTDVNLSLVQILQLLKTVYGFFPTTDVNLSTCSDATFENSLRTLPNNGCCSIAYSTSRLLKTVHGFSSNGC